MPIDSGNLALKGLDDLFSTEENRQEEQREQELQDQLQMLRKELKEMQRRILVMLEMLGESA